MCSLCIMLLISPRARTLASRSCPRLAVMKMMKLMPAVQKMMGGALAEHGFGADDLMTVAMQLQAFEEPSIKADVGKLMKAVMEGDVSGLV